MCNIVGERVLESRNAQGNEILEEEVAIDIGVNLAGAGFIQRFAELEVLRGNVEVRPISS